MQYSLLATYLKELVAAHAVPGAQFAVHHDGETWTWTHGEVRAGSGTPMTADAPVPVGSITKVVTAAAALVLVDDDDLDLDEPLDEPVPELRELPHGLRDRLTLRHVLSHTGGLPCDPADVRAATPRRHVVDCCRTARPLAEPGREFSYSNIGYLLAGHAITTITGMSWWEAVQALVLDPAGVPARFVTGPRVPADLVTGHSAGGRPVVQSLLELIRLRNAHPAFGGEFQLVDSPDAELEMHWLNGAQFARLRVDLVRGGFRIEYSLGNGEVGVLGMFA